MTKPFFFDPESKGFYSEDYHQSIPPRAFELTDAQYQEYIKPPAGKYFDCADGVPKLLDIPANTTPVEVVLTPQQKLERAGLTVDELKSLLGL